MALLVVVLAMAAPSLSHFFRGRNLDLEARRFLSLTRYGQSRSVSESVPMVLWIDAERGKYGLEADATYTANNSSRANNASAQSDTKAEEFSLDESLQMEVEQPVVDKSSGQWWQTTSTGLTSANNSQIYAGQNSLHSNLPQIHFSPDGSIGEASPARVVFRERKDKGVVEIAQSRNRLGYEIQTSNEQTARR